MLKRVQKYDLIALTIIIIGAILRLYHLFIIPMDEPFRLGGLFFEFSNQIIINNFKFPELIPYYSANGIPFAYPPLSFYLQAILIHLFNPQLFFTVNLLPPLISLFSLPAFYWMIRQYTDDIHLALAGLFAFALMPTAFINQIEAAGLAESLGVLTILLFLGFLLRWKIDPNWKDAILAGVLLSFCVLSSPGSAYSAALFSLIFFIWVFIQSLRDRSMKPVGMLLLTGMIGIALSAPYWLTVVTFHGSDFFITPFLGQHQASTAPIQIEQIISFQPAGNYLSFIWNWLILAGIIWSTLERHFLIIVIFILFWLIPREGLWMVAIPGAILAGCGLVYVMLPLFKKTFQLTDGSRPPLAPGIMVIILLILVFANSIFATNVSITESEWILNREQINALLEFQDEIPVNGRVIILGNLALTEWAPAILQHEVLNVEFGLEWQPDELEKVRAINAALEKDDFLGVISALETYTDDHQLYLISSQDGLDDYQATMPNNITLKLIATTPTLNLHIMNIK